MSHAIFNIFHLNVSNVKKNEKKNYKTLKSNKTCNFKNRHLRK